ncbi:hypothetical protein OG205_15590 [Lentzea sp. NBC_00516]|uniref:hypothetical protein n=1 Tax=Lentzea sp. NBC_00516 TaxID=2903582 RepID=UPI002E80F007|nr:hypothetical protein [Lentzea sp. NBC_00516]WUD28368.1 hypothetical protein OG205_15590 [Lentzea sp. NBC_00516]
MRVKPRNSNPFGTGTVSGRALRHVFCGHDVSTSRRITNHTLAPIATAETSDTTVRLRTATAARRPR